MLRVTTAYTFSTTNHWKHSVSRLCYLVARLHFLSSDSFSSNFLSSFLFSSLTIPTFAFPSVHIVGSLTAKLLSKIMSFTKRQMDTDRCFGMSLEACLSRQGLFVICLLSVLQLHDSSPTFGRRTAVSNGTTFWPTSCVGPGWTAVPQKTICKLQTDAVTLSSAFLFPGPFVTELAL